MGYLTAEGRVKNLTAAPIDGIKAIVTVKDASGRALRTDDALIEYKPLNPGQSSPFRVMVRLEEGSGDSKASVEFSADGVQLQCK